MESMDERKAALLHWLQECGVQNFSIEALPGDASFRRYFRIYTKEKSFIVMDAPPANENCEPYVLIANALRKAGLNAPEIIYANIHLGFLLITDFGDLTYLKVLNAENADQLYHNALSTLAVLQNCRAIPGREIPPFNRELMWQEWLWHKEWFLGKLLGLVLNEEEKALDHCAFMIIEAAVRQPQVFMHRDFHAANLMVLPNNEVGILDFQDAFIGPVTYDLVSLLRDCYIDWPEEYVVAWALDYQQKLKDFSILSTINQQEFLLWFDWMGIERHLKALFTFARKSIRDKQTHYLKHVPRTLHYLQQVSHRYPQLNALHTYLTRTVHPRFAEVMQLCVA